MLAAVVEKRLGELDRKRPNPDQRKLPGTWMAARAPLRTPFPDFCGPFPNTPLCGAKFIPFLFFMRLSPLSDHRLVSEVLLSEKTKTRTMGNHAEQGKMRKVVCPGEREMELLQVREAASVVVSSMRPVMANGTLHV